jgi:predicted esterase
MHRLVTKPCLCLALGTLLLLSSGASDLQGQERRGPPRVPSLSSGTKKKLGQLFESYFEADEAARPGILAEVEKLDPVPPSSVKGLTKTLFKLARKGLRTTGKNKRKLDHPDYPGTFLISGAKGGIQKGLFIGLHGGGEGGGDGATAAQKWQAAQGQGCICVFPTVIKKEGSAWNKEREERYVLALIEAVKRTYPVDTNRIYLAGHSMGGYGTWSIGGHNADLFAAISPNAGGLFVRMNPATREVGGLASGVLRNLLNTPVYFTHGADDRQVSVKPDRLAAEMLGKLREEHPQGYEHVYKEYPDIGHGLPPDGTVPIIKWLVKRKRDPYPKVVAWEPSVPWKRSFFWLRRTGGPGGLIVAGNKGENVIEITAKGGAKGLSVFISEKMVDLKKPVTVKVNGDEVFSDHVLPSAAALLESIAERNDRNMYFTGRIDL